MNFDDVLIRIGDCGRYQILLYLLFGLVGIQTGLQNLAHVFIGGAQDHWCYVPEIQNLSAADQKRLAIPLKDGGTGDKAVQYDSCHVYERNYSAIVAALLNDTVAGGYDVTNASDRFQALSEILETERTIVRKCSKWTFDQSQYTSTMRSEFGTICKYDWMEPLIQTIYMAGFMTGCIGFGAVSDRFGRHKTMVLALLLESITAVSAAFAPNYTTYVILRFIVGTAAAGAFTTSFVFVMEMMGPKYRMGMGIFVQGYFACGFMLLPGIAYFVRNHIMLQLSISIPFILLLVYWWIIPESPRWLISEGRCEEAQLIVEKIARLNGKIAPEKICFNVQVKVQEGPMPNVIDLVRTPNMRKKSLNIFFNWFVNSLIYYGLALSSEEMGGNIYLSIFISGAVEIPSYVLTCFVLNRIGRQRTLVFMMLLGGVACLCCAPLIKNEKLLPLLLTLANIGKFGISASFSIIYVYSAEVFPTVIRNVGVGTGSMHARIGGLIAPQIASLSKYWNPLPSIIFGSTAIAAGLLALLLPETLNQVLPETLEDGETFGKSSPKQKRKKETVSLMLMENGILRETGINEKTPASSEDFLLN
ncbi:organic cation transporter protein-like [Tubulanus polymorphus]|uniref:organic cation transporter protein-like n=1 Tax=Tubulanus polymorphus TaxID=672921 RepID=UPI003DA382F0